MPQIKNTQTGFVATAAPDNWSVAGSGYDPNIWKLDSTDSASPIVNTKEVTPAILKDNSSDVVGGSSGIKSQADALKAYQGANVSGGITTGGQIDPALAALNDKGASINTTTSAEDAAIKQAGINTATQYQPLIDAATKAKGKGLGLSEVSAGEAGGFMNTQMVGAAAEPGVSGARALEMGRYGTGGELARIQSEYDANINNLQTQKVAAVAAAESAAREAIRTGKQSAFDNAYKMYEAAKAADKAAQDAANAKTELLMKIAKFPAEMDQLANANLKTQTENIQTSIAPAMVQEIKPDGSNFADVVSKYSQQYNIDPTRLSSGVFNYQQQKQKEDWLNSSNAATVLGKTASGGTISTPYGDMKVMGQTLKGADGTSWRLNETTGKYENVGIPTSVNLNQILSLIDKASTGSDPELLKSLTDYYNQTASASGAQPFSYTGAGTSGNTAGYVTSPSGKTYDMSTYNTPGGQAYIKSLQDSINSVGKLSSVDDINNYLSTNMPNSKITAKDIMAVSDKTGVGWEEMLGIINKEANGGATPVALANNNFGGITWSQSYQDSHPGVTKGSARPVSEGGNYVKFPTVQSGLEAQAGQFSKREVTPQKMAESGATEWIKDADSSAPDKTIGNIAPANIGRTPNSIYQNALAYAVMGGNLQQFVGGLSGTGQAKTVKDAIDNKASAIMDAAGVTPYDLRKEFAADKLGLSSLYKQFTIRKAGELGAVANSDLVSQYSGEAGRSSSPLVNKYTLWAQENVEGKTQPVNLETAIYAFSREYARVATGQTGGAGLTDGATAATTRLMSAAKNPQQLQSEMNVMKQEMANVMKGQTDMITQITTAENLPNLQKFNQFVAGQSPQGVQSNLQTPTNNTAASNPPMKVGNDTYIWSASENGYIKQ